MSEAEEFARSIETGGRAFNYIKQNQTPAVPQNYELWYTYATGANRALIEAVNDAITANSILSKADAARIFEQFLSADRLTDTVDMVGTQISTELEEIITHLQTAATSTGEFGKNLDGLTAQLGNVKSTSQLTTVVQTLAGVTKEMADNSRDLENQLTDSTRQIEKLHQSLEEARAESNTDALTGIGNRKKFDAELVKQMTASDQSLEPLCLLLTDIDHFKSFNDTWGHQTGDQVLRLVAHMLKTNIKGRDLAARYGGEEFAVVLPNTTLRDAVTVAEQIRKAIRGKELVKKSTGENLGRITISIGAALYQKGDEADTIIHRADACLYAAKHAGRDQVKCQTDPDVTMDFKVA